MGVAHEGPPGYGHDGISAMLLDERTNERTGRACAAAGKPGMTVIATQQEPSTMLVEADGIFVAPDPEAARTLFPARYDAEQVADR